ncbi:MAG: efflux RND transporter periplasmic adaptor subunit [Synergistaceae bacterium]|jgi:RND family efflux transporter MFP subunit|nr:efflux RND transporter periplasmic adaptor subunit [Synergistaceae bacterium]
MTLPEHTPQKDAGKGPGRSNFLKSLAAFALMGILAFFSSSRFEEISKRLLNSVQSVTPSPASAADEAAAPPAPPAPPVVGHVVAIADLALGREYIGRVEPVQTVLVKPRISGQIESIHFKEGSLVSEGDLLFTIDSAQYQAIAQQRKADLAKAQASLSRAVKYNDRLKAADKRSVSASDADMAASDVEQSRAAVEQAKAALRLAQIDLDFTRITAPISGRIGRAEATRGNFVTPAGAPLTSIVQTDPIRVSYAMSDRNYMEQIGAFRSSGAVFDAALTLVDGTSYPHKGERDFEENEMDAMTGTITVYLRFANKEGALIPGSMVRVNTKPVKSRTAPIVPQEALLADSSGDFVYVIDENNAAQRRGVSLGTETGTYREIVSGLASGEKIIVKGLHNVRPGMTVRPNYPSADQAAKSPSELARESGYDLLPISGGNQTGAD